MKGTDDVNWTISNLGGAMIDRNGMAIGQGAVEAHALCPARLAP